MLTIPDDLIRSPEFTSIQLAQATVTEYCAKERVLSAQVLVTRPTLVLVRSGVKQLRPHQSEIVHTAPAGNLVAFRSGAHLMSEFRADDDVYRSVVVTLERSFLREVIGLPAEHRAEGAKAVISQLPPEIFERISELPATIADASSTTEKDYCLRDFIVTAMSDAGVRNLLFDEVADWGTTAEGRIGSVLRNHCLSPLRIEDLATLSGMSLATFKRHFRAIYKMPPGEWLQKTRLQHAHTLALNGKLNIADICEASGYQDLSSFSRAFKRLFGETPSSVRAQALR